MGRGVSSGGGQSSLGYLFGGDEAPKPAEKPAPVQKPTPPSSVDNKLKDIPAGIESSKASMRIEGQNCGNFLTELNFWGLLRLVVHHADANGIYIKLSVPDLDG